MSKLIYKMGGVSADGYIADAQGNFDWGAPDQELHQFHNDQVRAQGAQLLGRRLYETMLYWETDAADAGPIERDFATIWRAQPKIVFSRTLETVQGANMSLARANLATELAALRHSVRGTIGIGGAGLAAEAFRLGLIDEVQLLLYPVAVGGGTPVFPKDFRVDMEPVETRTFGSRVVYIRYRVISGRQS